MKQRKKEGFRSNDSRKKIPLDSFHSNNQNNFDYFNKELRESYRNGTNSKNSSSSKKRKRVTEENSSEGEDGKKKRKVVSVKRDVLNFYKNRPTLRYSNIGGIEKILSEIKTLIHRPFEYPEVYQELGVDPIRGVLLHGPPGCGKTTLARAIAGELGEINVKFFSVSGPELARSNVGESEEKMRGLFQLAVSQAPSLVFFDELDAMVPKRDSSKGIEKRLVSQLCVCLDELNFGSKQEGENLKHVILIAATNRPEMIDTSLRRAGRFDKEIPLGMPNEKAREKILKVLTQGKKISENVNLSALSRVTPGYVGADLSALIQEACNLAISRIFSLCKNESEMKDLTGMFITMDDFDKALPKVQPSSKREGFTTVPDVTWDDVGSLENVRKELESCILKQITHLDYYQHMGLCDSAGIILFGPPGCGKTLLAKAVANDCRANFISVKGPELLNKYVGETERAVRIVFQRARTSSPCVIFFDELDALCPKRSGGSINKVTDRVVNQLLTELEGLHSRKNVHVIAATNRIDIIDPAVLRPGRLGKVLYVPLPSYEARIKIMSALMRKSPVDKNLDVEGICKKCENFSGADLKFLLKEASIVCLNNALGSKMKKEDILVRNEHFFEALKKIKPSVSEYERKRYELLALQYYDVRNLTE